MQVQKWTVKYFDEKIDIALTGRKSLPYGEQHKIDKIFRKDVLLAMERQLIGQVNHYYSKIGVAIIQLEEILQAGDHIAVVGSTTDVEQDVKSMQVEHQNIEEAKKGDLVGLKVKDKVREGDAVYKLYK